MGKEDGRIFLGREFLFYLGNCLVMDGKGIIFKNSLDVRSLDNELNCFI